MLPSLQNLYRHRQLIAVLTARDLKARYRGSALGFFWSLANPLLLLGVYTLVFTRFFPRPDLTPFALFLFCGILPWTFFSAAVLESTDSIFSNAGLIKKVMFPAESLPLVVVLSHLTHFVLALPVLLAAALVFAVAGSAQITLDILFAPLLMLLQAIFVAGIAMMVSSASVLFRDLKDLVANFLQLGFFLTPVLYRLETIRSVPLRMFLRLNPMTPFILGYQDIFFFSQPPRPLDLGLMFVYASLSLAAGLTVFDRLRDTLAEAI